MVRIYGNTTEKTEDEEWTAVLGKIKESIDKSLVSVSVKSGTYLETEKLKAKVGNVQEEIHNLKQELGEAIFAQWKNGGVNPQTIESACAALNRKEAEIAGYQAQIDQITLEKARILGEELKPAATGREGGVTCSCGKVNAPGAKFCKACGKKLESGAEAAQETAQSRRCPSCGALMEPGARFCCECGHQTV